MKKKVGLAPLIASLLVACGDPGDPAFTSEPDPGVLRSALLGDNALSYNALNLNGIGLNALSRNALSYNSLDPTLREAWDAANRAAGVKVTILLSGDNASVPAMRAPPGSVTVNWALLRSTSSANDAVTVDVRSTWDAPVSGVWLCITGATLSAFGW